MTKIDNIKILRGDLPPISLSCTSDKSVVFATPVMALSNAIDALMQAQIASLISRSARFTPAAARAAAIASTPAVVFSDISRLLSPVLDTSASGLSPARARAPSRLGAYCEPAVIELRESRIHGSGEAAETKVKEEEGCSILSKITVDMYVMTLEIKGRSLSSEQFADKINALALEGRSNIAFVIGGSLGLSPEIYFFKRQCFA